MSVAFDEGEARLLDIKCISDTTPEGSLARTKRYGRTLVSPAAAADWAYQAHIVGADHANLAGNCNTPVMVAVTGLQGVRLSRLKQWKQGSMDYADGWGFTDGFASEQPRHIDLAVRCRKCPACLEARRRHWALRAMAEVRDANRTWFGTLTLAPEQQFRLVAEAVQRLGKGAVDYHALEPDDQFKERCKPLVEEFQRYMKRVRKDHSGVRYLAVTERHKSGAPHMHVLVHERGDAVRHKRLTERWRWGFSKFNLVAEGESAKAINYVAKYLTKSLVLRVVASQNYGKTSV